MEVQKFKLNSIPVYRVELEDEVEYRLFENERLEGNLIRINSNIELGKQLDTVYNCIQNLVGKKLTRINSLYTAGMDK